MLFYLRFAVFIMLITSPISADEIIWKEDFETGFDDYNWPWYGEPSLWEFGKPINGPATVSDATGLTGTNMAAVVLKGNYPADTDSRLYYKYNKNNDGISLPNLTDDNELLELRLSHWYDYQYADYGQVQIQIQKDDLTWSEWTNLGPRFTGSIGVWHPSVNYAINMNHLAGKKIRISFWHEDRVENTNWWEYRSIQSSGWFIDSVSIVKWKPVFHEVENFDDGHADWSVDNTGVWQIGVPTSGPQSAYDGTGVAATILDGNYPYNRSSRLISTAFILPATGNDDDTIEIRYRHWYSYGGGDYGQVMVSVWNANAKQWGEWSNIGNSISGYTNIWTTCHPD